MRSVDEICQHAFRFNGIWACGAVNNYGIYAYAGDPESKPIITQAISLIQTARLTAPIESLSGAGRGYNIRMGVLRLVCRQWGVDPTFDVVILMQSGHRVTRSVQRLLRTFQKNYCTIDPKTVQSQPCSPANEPPAPSSSVPKTAPSSPYPEGTTPATGGSQGDV